MNISSEFFKNVIVKSEVQNCFTHYKLIRHLKNLLYLQQKNFFYYFLIHILK